MEEEQKEKEKTSSLGVSIITTSECSNESPHDTTSTLILIEGSTKVVVDMVSEGKKIPK